MNILVCGGAGYVGAHTCIALADAGFTPVSYDNLSNGHRDFVQWGPLIVGDLNDSEHLIRVMTEFQPVGVVHFAASIEVGESVEKPLAYYRKNVGGTLSLLAAAEQCGIDKIVFSSTCATYGDPTHVPIDENHQQQPLNPYGRSKLIVEQVLSDLDDLRNVRSVCLRYFNAAGADDQTRIGEAHSPETHIIPIAFDVARKKRAVFSINGDDYDTRDGTCIRDYVHVADLADAHVKSLQMLLDGGASHKINLGTGTGTSILELLAQVEKTSGLSVERMIGARRPGDASVLLADNSHAKSVLNWQPRFGLEEIVETAWRWHQKAG